MPKAKYIRRILYFVLLILLGIFMFVWGEYDDSPGGQLLGVVLGIVGIIVIIKTKARLSKIRVQGYIVCG